MESLGVSQLFKETGFKDISTEECLDLSGQLQALFEEDEISTEIYEEPNGLIALKTSALVILFCFSVAVGIYVGNGTCIIKFIFKD